MVGGVVSGVVGGVVVVAVFRAREEGGDLAISFS